jgi:hypothetical protein
MEDVDGIPEEDLGSLSFYQGLPSTSELLYFAFFPLKRKLIVSES